MLHVSICDDNQEQLALIHDITAQFFAARPDWSAQIEAFHHPLLFLDSLDKNGGCDIALLDICMPGVSGTELAKTIRQRKDKTEIIFITTSDEFGVDAFALKATHYLLKPFAQDEFNEAMTRAATRAFANCPCTLPIKIEDGSIRSVDINEIQYIESCDHIQSVHLCQEVCTETRRSLSRLHEELERLAPGQFIAPYKGYVVNQKAIVTIESRYILLRCGVKIPIPRGTFRELQAQYLAFQFSKSDLGVQPPL